VFFAGKVEQAEATPPAANPEVNPHLFFTMNDSWFDEHIFESPRTGSIRRKTC